MSRMEDDQCGRGFCSRGYNVRALLTWLELAPFRKLRQENSEQGKGKVTDFIKYDIRQMHTAFTGTIPFSREEEDALVSPPSLRLQTAAFEMTCASLPFPLYIVDSLLSLRDRSVP